MDEFVIESIQIERTDVVPRGHLVISGCADSDGATTGGGSQPLPAISLATGGTVTWLSGDTTFFGAPSLVPTSAKHCPGYSKTSATNPTAEKFSGAVTSSTAGFKVPGTYKGEVCISTKGVITAPKPLKVS